VLLGICGNDAAFTIISCRAAACAATIITIIKAVKIFIVFGFMIVVVTSRSSRSSLGDAAVRRENWVQSRLRAMHACTCLDIVYVCIYADTLTPDCDCIGVQAPRATRA